MGGGNGLARGGGAEGVGVGYAATGPSRPPQTVTPAQAGVHLHLQISDISLTKR